MLLITTKSTSVYPIGRVSVLPWEELLIHPYALHGTPPQSSPLSTVERTILMATRKPPVVDKSWLPFLSRSKVCLMRMVSHGILAPLNSSTHQMLSRTCLTPRFLHPSSAFNPRRPQPTTSFADHCDIKASVISSTQRILRGPPALQARREQRLPPSPLQRRSLYSIHPGESLYIFFTLLARAREPSGGVLVDL